MKKHAIIDEHRWTEYCVQGDAPVSSEFGFRPRVEDLLRGIVVIDVDSLPPIPDSNYQTSHSDQQ